MSLAYIRNHYRVPAKRGVTVSCDSYRYAGTITGASGPHLLVKPFDAYLQLNGLPKSTRHILHPTWRMTYHLLDSQGGPQHFGLDA